jgi:hypothetical protein
MILRRNTPTNLGVNSPSARKLSMARGQRSNDAELSRAARNLIIAHGSRAAGVAETRARRLDECGEDEVAETWRQIGIFVRALEAGKNPTARHQPASQAQAAVVVPPGAIPTARMQPIHPCSIHSLVLRASLGGQQPGAANPRTRPHMETSRATNMRAHKYTTGDVNREPADLEHWVGIRSHETARLIGSVAPR